MTGALQLLATRLPDLVGSPLSLNSLREDLQVAHKTVSRWVDIFERMYMIFRLSPFGSPAIRAVKKEQKHYFFDWNTVEDPGSRFENMAALHLYKWVCYKQNTEGRDYELNYFRDTDGREVDFVVTDRNRPLILVEAKSSERNISKSLKYLQRKFPDAEAYQISSSGKKNYVNGDGIRVMPALDFMKTLV